MRDRHGKKRFLRSCIDQAPRRGCFDFGAISGPLIAGGASALVGGLMGGGGQGGTVQNVQSNTPFNANYLNDLYAKALGQYNVQGGAGYGGPYASPTSPYTTQAIQQQAASATDPAGLVSQAQGQLGKTIGGDYLSPDSNPYLKGAVQTALDAAKRGVSGQFTGENFGSSANQEWLGRNLANTALPIYAQNYANERGIQQNAIAQAPGMQMANTSQLAAAGSAEQAEGQRQITGAQQQFYSPWDMLSRLQGTYAGAPGGTTTTNTPYFTNPMASAIGGGIGGLSLYNMINRAGLLGGGQTFSPGYVGSGANQAANNFDMSYFGG